MRLTLAYGRTGLEVDLPDQADVVTPRAALPVPDEAAALTGALRHPIQSPPLVDLVRPGDRVVIVHTDITRPTPNDRILPPLLAELERAGVPDAAITLVNGVGTHRLQTDQELRAMLGEAVVRRYRCLQHDCHDAANLISLGSTSRGNPVRINRTYVEADRKILTGFIEPHFFAGFSGGPKAILPSLSGHESVFSNHGAAMIAHPGATWGVMEGNPIWEEMREVALMTHPDFLLNVTLNRGHQITGVFAGNMLAAHALGCAFVRESAMAAVDQLYDIVLVTNSGYPLDQNLYQAVKGMSAGRQVVKQGGAIIIAAACQDGLPAHGSYARLLIEHPTPADVLRAVIQPGFNEQDQWQVQLQAQIQCHADVYVYSDGLTDEQIRQAQLVPCRNLEQTLALLMEKVGPAARLCVIPDGPQTIPYLRTAYTP